MGRLWHLPCTVAPAYDAIYVTLAETLTAVLVTGDRRLVGAPGMRAAIEWIGLIQPGLPGLPGSTSGSTRRLPGPPVQGRQGVQRA